MIGTISQGIFDSRLEPYCSENGRRECSWCFISFYCIPLDTPTLLRPLVLVGNLEDNFFAGVMVKYRVIFGAALACYPFDTVRRRNMMTLGEAIMYKKNSWDAFNQIIKNEGAKSLFKDSGAKILHTTAITVAFVGCRQFYFSSI